MRPIAPLSTCEGYPSAVNSLSLLVTLSANPSSSLAIATTLSRHPTTMPALLKAYFGSWAAALKPYRVCLRPRAAPMPGSAPGISGAESGLAPGPPPEADGDMHRDPFRLLEAALRRSSGARQRLGRASFTHAATTEMSGPSVEP